MHSVLEPEINKVLQYDPNANAKLAKLEQKSFAVVLTDLSIQIKLWVNQGVLTFSSNTEKPDCYVETSSQYLKQLSDASQLTKLIKNDQLMLEGDLAIAQAFSGLLLENDIDWQSLLSRYVGDGMAHRIVQSIHNLKRVLIAKQADLDYTIASALVDEIKVAPSQLEVDDYVVQVDKINARTEKLASIINSLRG